MCGCTSEPGERPVTGFGGRRKRKNWPVLGFWGPKWRGLVYKGSDDYFSLWLFDFVHDRGTKVDIYKLALGLYTCYIVNRG